MDGYSDSEKPGARHGDRFGKPETTVPARHDDGFAPVEDVLLKNERLLRAFIDHTPVAIAMLDRDMRYLAASGGYLTSYHLSTDDPVGRSHYELFPEIPDRWKDIHRRCLAGATERCEGEPFPRADGTVDWVRWEIIPWHEEDGRIGGILLFSEVITERVEMEQRLADQTRLITESEAKYRVIFDQALIPVILFELPGLTITDVNRATEALTGYTREEMLGQNGESLGLHSSEPESKMRAGFEAQGLLRGRHAEIVTKSGQAKTITIDASPIESGGRRYILATVLDITERLSAETLLRDSEERYRSMQEHSMDAMILGSPDGSVLTANPAARAMFQRDEEPEQMQGRSAYMDADDPRVELFMEAWKDAGSARGEMTLVRADGSRFEGEVSAANFTDSKGVERTNIIIHDLTRQRATEAALRESDARLQQSQKMEAVGQLAGGIAHDFNNLLTSIFGYTDLALEHEAMRDEGLKECLLEVKRAAERAGTLTRQILAFSRRQALRPEVVSLNSVLVGMETLLRRTLGEQIDLVMHLAAGGGQAEIDVHQFEQVLLNLVLNAHDAMPSGGRLAIETGVAELDEAYCSTHPDAEPGRYLALTVSDTGTGMDEETASRVFEPFFTTKSVGEGTGLGLSMVYGTVRQSGGSISVSSEPGRGTSFTIYVPVVGEEAAPDDEAATQAPAPAGGHETIMIVEDDEPLRELACRILEQSGYTTRAFANGAQALAALEKDQGPLDLLLTDVVLPGELQGNRLAERVVALRPGLPVLYMSGYARDTIVHEGRVDEGVNFLEKPFSSQGLATGVREALDRARRP